ncbi:helix-turn-helix domain-containing protein [Streptomyces sp. N2-109]|uniref:Helix-turn-helix domain-containing protein n=1 Tax=Streptomyces gossypii TaxID=2883101 RepID=A0ABT2JRN2_9ACTN|nr:helix-turn-helix domain-containing protein [Streptomyces gossypii]MCT2590548.1 helix-turn-helix domain-containing protein [Streptomyces gossypii]
MTNQYGNPVTADERTKLRSLHAEGLGRNDIARRLGRAQRTVSVLAADMGLTFNRTATEEATHQATTEPLKSSRTALSEAPPGRLAGLWGLLAEFRYHYSAS